MKCIKCSAKAQVSVLTDMKPIVVIGFCDACELEWSWTLDFDETNPHEQHSTAYK